MMMSKAFDTTEDALREHIKGLRIVLGDRLFNEISEEAKRRIQ